MPGIVFFSTDKQVAERLSNDLTSLGYSCLVVSEFDQLKMATEQVIVIDHRCLDMFTEESREELVSRLKKVFMVLVRRGQFSNRFLSLAEELIFFPYQMEELSARLQLLFSKLGVSEAGIVKIAQLTLNLDSYEVLVSGKPIELTYKEYELLKFLALHPDRVFKREILLDQVWEYDYYGGSRTVDVHVRRLRAKLGSKYGGLIETVRNVGYRFRLPSN
jgi:DNA-binding response OmpR family regulator